MSSHWYHFPQRMSLWLVFMTLFAACQSPAIHEDLPGEWQAVSLVVQDSVWNVETDPVKLNLGEDMKYHLLWYSGEEEIGEWEYKPPHLIIKSEPTGKRFLTIIDIQRDSLVLQGLQEARSVQLGFVRIIPPSFNEEQE